MPTRAHRSDALPKSRCTATAAIACLDRQVRPFAGNGIPHGTVSHTARYLPWHDLQVRCVQAFEKLQRDGKGESLRNAEIHFTGGDVRCRRPPARPPAAQLSFASPG